MAAVTIVKAGSQPEMTTPGREPAMRYPPSALLPPSDVLLGLTRGNAPPPVGGVCRGPLLGTEWVEKGRCIWKSERTELARYGTSIHS